MQKQLEGFQIKVKQLEGFQRQSIPGNREDFSVSVYGTVCV